MSTATDVRDMLADAGQTVTITGTVAGTYNTANGSVSGTAYSVTAKAALLPLKPYKQEQNTNIQAGDERMLLAAIDTSGAVVSKPPLNSKITLASGAKYTLIAVDPLHPDGTELLFDCVVRGNA